MSFFDYWARKGDFRRKLAQRIWGRREIKAKIGQEKVISEGNLPKEFGAGGK